MPQILTLLVAVSALTAARVAPQVWTSGERMRNAGEHAERDAPRRAGPQTGREGARARLVAAARRHVGKRFRGDCNDFVRRVYAEAHVPLPPPARGRSATESIFRSLVLVRRPRPGDLAFFHRTYDREVRGRRRNLFTHVALVESVEGPRVSLIHRGSRGIRRLTMNLARPADPDENGPLRRHRPDDNPKQRYLASELFAGFASALGGERRSARGSQRGRHDRETGVRPSRERRSPR